MMITVKVTQDDYLRCRHGVYKEVLRRIVKKKVKKSRKEIRL